MTQKLFVQTSKGQIVAEIARDNGVLQFNAFHAPGGVGFFLVFPDGEGQEDAVTEAARILVEGGPLEPNANITARVPGCLTAGTSGSLRGGLGLVTGMGIAPAEFGTPEVSRA